MWNRKTERGGGSDKDGRRHKERDTKLDEEEKRDFFPSMWRFFPSRFSLQTDAKADGGELAENGRRRNETVY